MKFNLVKIVQDFSSFFPMLWAICRGRWKIPWNTLFWAILCLVYLFSPIDLLPDVLPLIGITDDGAFILLVLTLLHKDLEAFRAHQAASQNIIDVTPVSTEKNSKK